MKDILLGVFHHFKCQCSLLLLCYAKYSTNKYTDNLSLFQVKSAIVLIAFWVFFGKPIILTTTRCLMLQPN